MSQVIAIITSLWLITASTFAQSVQRTESPKTKLETFIAQSGAVILKGFTTVGTVKGLVNSSVSVDAKEFTDAMTGKGAYGITLEVKEYRSSGIYTDNTSYIDYDEIESLINGLDYIAKIDKSSTKLDDFQADYNTRGDLKISVFSGTIGGGLFSAPKSPTTYLSVQSGVIGRTTAFFKKEDIGLVRDLIIKAKEKLDSIRK